MNPETVLALARAELETKEYPPGSNNVKYNTDYYGREVSGSQFNWCAVFIWWLFQRVGAPQLFCGGGKTAYVPALMDHAIKNGLTVGTPEPGDIVCFDFDNNGIANHVGICESYNGKRVTTIDGNTGVGNDANGGAVMRRTRDEKYIVCVIHPPYEKEESMDISKLTDEQILALANRIDEVRGKQPPSEWSEEAREWAEKSGIIAGDENGEKKYKKACTREELVQILYNQQ